MQRNPRQEERIRIDTGVGLQMNPACNGIWPSKRWMRHETKPSSRITCSSTITFGGGDWPISLCSKPSANPLLFLSFCLTLSYSELETPVPIVDYQ